ncbi:alkene reductase [Bradyrhizobium ganzhouense]|uniref:alkene reductase n=1 Tax=Bradyrhizobium ganzhouense TaxID=1179767 RepID=UPI003CFBBCC8
MPDGEQKTLFSTYDLNGLALNNRVAMASMTRGRARNEGLVPTELHVEYYRQRATAGLILTEATWISRESIGFINVPGLFTLEQAGAWRKVVDGVHAKGGRIYVQLAHTGAVSHPDFFDGELPLAPSAVNPGLMSFTPTGFKDTVMPRAMTVGQIKATVLDYAAAARNAKAAGFDGVELHSATTYLLPQFLNSALNVRQDEYGGNHENRARIVIEILNALVEVWGPGRVGVKLSPTMAMGGFVPTDQTVATYDHLVERLNDIPLSHLQLVRATSDLTGTPIRALQDTVGYYRPRFKGTLIANGGFDKPSANAIIGSRNADLVSFGSSFIGNPDLVHRLRDDVALKPSRRDTYYQGGAEGYIDHLATS